jgi:hypothetical protein
MVTLLEASEYKTVEAAEGSPMVTKIQVWTGKMVDKYIFTYTDGQSRTFGSDTGTEATPFVIDSAAGEYVVKVSARIGDSTDMVNFTTNKGRTSETYGPGSGGNPKEWSATSGYMITGLTMEPGGWTQRITGIEQAPVPKDPCCPCPSCCVS